MIRTRLQCTASSLLITLLVMTAISTLTLLVAKNTLLSTRVASNEDSSRLAYQIAQSGIEDGLLRYKAGLNSGSSLGLVNGEYGDLTSSPYNLAPRRRGYFPTNTAICQNLGPDQSLNMPNNQNCPYYDLAVHKKIALKSGDSLVYSAREVPPGHQVTFEVRSTGFFNITPNFPPGSTNPTLNYQTCAQSTCTTSSPLPNGQPLGITSATTSLILLANSTLDSRGLLLNGISGDVVIDRGFTTIDSIGYAGGSQKHLLLFIRSYDPTVNPPTGGTLMLQEVLGDYVGTGDVSYATPTFSPTFFSPSPSPSFSPSFSPASNPTPAATPGGTPFIPTPGPSGTPFVPPPSASPAPSGTPFVPPSFASTSPPSSTP